MEKRKHKRSLEWACAAARLEGKRAAARNDHADDDNDETDEEEFHEAITPMGSLIGDVFLDRRSIDVKNPADEEKPRGSEEELMGAALLLCGLGRKIS